MYVNVKMAAIQEEMKRKVEALGNKLQEKKRKKKIKRGSEKNCR